MAMRRVVLENQGESRSISILFKEDDIVGELKVHRGSLDRLSIGNGKNGWIEESKFHIHSSDSARLNATFSEVSLAVGAYATVVTIQTNLWGFSFFLRDVSISSPIWLPEYGVAVTEESDSRTYNQLSEDIRRMGCVSQLQMFEAEAEETYENACRHNRDLLCPTWLGLSRDMRIFFVEHLKDSGFWGYVKPHHHSFPLKVKGLKESENEDIEIHFAIGPGESCSVELTRWLEEGVLPIVRSRQIENDVVYDVTAFATLENSPLYEKNVIGSNWEAAYAKTSFNMLDEKKRQELDELIVSETFGREEEVVCCIKAKAVNRGKVPRYAWFKAGRFSLSPYNFAEPAKSYDGSKGFSLDYESKVYAINMIDGCPMPQREMAILLAPGESVNMDILIPHQALSVSRASKLSEMDIEEHLVACRSYWRGKLFSASQIIVPEQTINERIYAGLLNCDMNAIGEASGGPILATVGWYGPIGSESAPIIQFFDSIGWHDLAERSIDFFLARQREDGFMQNYCGYQLETGPVLWTMGEHYRYTNDDNWVRRVQPNIIKACNYLIAWRNRNKTSELRENGQGYGMLDGKVADPDDFFHSFMLNALSYLGIKRAAEILENVNPVESKRLAQIASEFRKDIRDAYIQAVIKAPVIPAGDGSWVPTAPPWPDYRGPLSLYADGGEWETHGAFGARDTLCGSLYLVIGEVLDADESLAEMLLKFHQILFTKHNAGLSQPYYCRHDYIHLKRREVKAFLKMYYNQLSALSDRETYTFWEHYHYASQNKTHETAWFLMQTRWMLYFEEADTLDFLRGIPRKWMEDGKSISLSNVSTYFGPASLVVESKLKDGVIKAKIFCQNDRKPANVTIRLPHPQGQKAVKCEGGIYDSQNEVVSIDEFTGEAEVVLYFNRSSLSHKKQASDVNVLENDLIVKKYEKINSESLVKA